MKKPISEAQRQQRRNNGLALKEKYGEGYFKELRKKGGGRPRFEEWVKEAKSREPDLSSRPGPRPGRVSKKGGKHPTPHPAGNTNET